VGTADFVTPISSSDWHHVQFGINNTTFDGDLDFFGDLDSHSDVSVFVSNDDPGLESGSLAGLGLFLNGTDFHYFFLQLDFLSFHQMVNNLGFFNGNGKFEDFFQSGDSSIFD